nr:zinc finger protein 665-like [Danaus plexippus plexippus]
MEIKSTNQVSPIEIMTEVKIEYDSSNSEHVPLVEIQKRKPAKKSQNIKKDKKELKNKPVKRNVSSLQKQYEGKIRIVVLSQDEMLEERQVEAKKPSYLRLPYKCDLCITAFDHELTLKSHIESRHNKSGEYECCVCKSHLSTKISFDEHYKRHFRRYECIECGKRTNNLYPLLKHYNDNHGLIQLEFSCKTCDYKTDKYRVFRYHLEKHRQSNVECDLCGKTFVNNNGLKTHLYTVHGQSSRVYGCDKCNKVYKAKSGLSAHIATHSSPVYCRDCDTRHTSTVHGQSSRVYGCDKCNKVYKAKSGLSAHIATHSSPVYCRDCDTHFRTPHGLRHHLKTHSRHVEDNDKRFVCKDCDLKFLTPKSLREHVDWVHLNDTKYECDSCSKVFKNKNSLKKHFQYVHEKKRPPRNKICDHCGRAFTTLQILRSHIHTHTGERPHRCDVCGASFAHKGALYTHNKLLHNKQ